MGNYVDSLGNVMNCQTEPIYDRWGWGDYWMCGDWITWHKMLMAECSLTQEQANLKVQQALSDRDLFGHEWFCQFDKDFREYFEAQGNDFGVITNVVNNLGDTAEDTSDALGDIGKYIKIALPVTLVSIALFYGIKAYKELR